MPKLNNQFILLARDNTIDSNDSMQSISKIIDIFTFNVVREDFKAQLSSSPINALELNAGSFVLLTNWRFVEQTNKPFSGTFTISIVSPDGHSIVGEAIPFEVPADQVGYNLNANLQSLPISVSGDYSIVVSIKNSSGKQISSASYTFTVNIFDSNTKELL